MTRPENRRAKFVRFELELSRESRLLASRSSFFRLIRRHSNSAHTDSFAVGVDFHMNDIRLAADRAIFDVLLLFRPATNRSARQFLHRTRRKRR